jgi:hypothetical protein
MIANTQVEALKAEITCGFIFLPALLNILRIYQNWLTVSNYNKIYYTKQSSSLLIYLSSIQTK